MKQDIKNQGNWLVCRHIIEAALKIGVTDFCICAGARNAPLVQTLLRLKDLHAWHFFDERSAGFFALGKIRQQGKPVAVLTTSGTAAVEVFPAVVEAYYSRAPLLIITADRPKTYRGTGAPQAIEQQNLFGIYVEKFVDIDVSRFLPSDWSWSQSFSAHWNVCLDEPQGEPPAEIFTAIEKASAAKTGFVTEDLPAKHLPLPHSMFRKPLVVCGPMLPWEKALAQQWLKDFKGPVFNEFLSGLR